MALPMAAAQQQCFSAVGAKPHRLAAAQVVVGEAKVAVKIAEIATLVVAPKQEAATNLQTAKTTLAAALQKLSDLGGAPPVTVVAAIHARAPARDLPSARISLPLVCMSLVKHAPSRPKLGMERN